MIKKSNLIYKLINYSYYEIIYLLKIISLRSFSQLNEDIVIDRLLKKEERILVDVGCYSQLDLVILFSLFKKKLERNMYRSSRRI